jgi:hypothetical protein
MRGRPLEKAANEGNSFRAQIGRAIRNTTAQIKKPRQGMSGQSIRLIDRIEEVRF